jgi:Fe(3+) dicitrate transport protein
MDKKICQLRLFASISFIDSRYRVSKPSLRQNWTKYYHYRKQPFGQPSGKCPRYIHNLGLSWSNNQFSTMQYRISGKVFTDANNTTAPSANGVTGLLDAYRVFDLSTEYKFFKITI